MTIHSFLTKHFYCLTIHPLLATIILLEFDNLSTVDNTGSVTVHSLLGPLQCHGRVSRCLRGWAGVCRRFPFGTGRFITAVHCPFLAGRLKQNVRHEIPSCFIQKSTAITTVYIRLSDNPLKFLSPFLFFKQSEQCQSFIFLSFFFDRRVTDSRSFTTM